MPRLRESASSSSPLAGESYSLSSQCKDRSLDLRDRFCGIGCTSRSHSIACFEVRSDFRFSLAFPFCSFGEPYETFGRVAHCQLAKLRLLVSVREHLESSESFVIQGWRSDSKERPCGRRRTAVVTTEAGYAIPAI